MKNSQNRLERSKLVVLLAFTAMGLARAEEARFFRVVGPVPTTITRFTAEGFLTWTNLPTNATFTVQSAPRLLTESNRLVLSNWCDYVQIPATNSVTTWRITDPHPPAGMVLIPGGGFTCGNCLDPGEGDANELPVHTVYVSAFYMDRTEVTKALWDEVYNWAISHGYSFTWGANGKAANHPVDQLSW